MQVGQRSLKVDLPFMQETSHGSHESTLISTRVIRVDSCDPWQKYSSRETQGFFKLTAVSLQPGKSPEELTFDLKGYRFANNDSIRGNRALLGKPNPAVFSGGSSPPYEVEAAILDLATNNIKTIGKFKGGWRTASLMHPLYSLGWITPEQAKLRQSSPSTQPYIKKVSFGKRNQANRFD